MKLTISNLANSVFNGEFLTNFSSDENVLKKTTFAADDCRQALLEALD